MGEGGGIRECSGRFLKLLFFNTFLKITDRIGELFITLGQIQADCEIINSNPSMGHRERYRRDEHRHHSTDTSNHLKKKGEKEVIKLASNFNLPDSTSTTEVLTQECTAPFYNKYC